MANMDSFLWEMGQGLGGIGVGAVGANTSTALELIEPMGLLALGPALLALADAADTGGVGAANATADADTRFLSCGCSRACAANLALEDSGDALLEMFSQRDAVLGLCSVHSARLTWSRRRLGAREEDDLKETPDGSGGVQGLGWLAEYVLCDRDNHVADGFYVIEGSEISLDLAQQQRALLMQPPVTDAGAADRMCVASVAFRLDTRHKFHPSVVRAAVRLQHVGAAQAVLAVPAVPEGSHVLPQAPQGLERELQELEELQELYEPEEGLDEPGAEEPDSGDIGGAQFLPPFSDPLRRAQAQNLSSTAAVTREVEMVCYPSGPVRRVTQGEVASYTAGRDYSVALSNADARVCLAGLRGDQRKTYDAWGEKMLGMLCTRGCCMDAIATFLVIPGP